MDSGPVDCGHTEGDASAREVKEEQWLATQSLLSPTRSVVAWKMSATDASVGSVEEPVEEKTPLSRGSESKTSENSEDPREEQLTQGGNEDVALTAAKENGQEENIDQILCTREQDEIKMSNEYEKPESLSDAMSKSGGKAVAEEESERTVTLDDGQGKDEMTKITVMEEDDTMQHEDKPDLRAEESKVELCTKMAARQEQNQLLVFKELADDYRDFKGSMSFTSLHAESQTAFDQSGNLSEDEQKRVTGNKCETNNPEDAEEKEDKGEQDAVTEVENMNRQKNDANSVPRDISTRHVTSSEELWQNAETELHTVESTDGEDEDVNNYLEVQTKAGDDVETEGSGQVIDGKYDVATIELSRDERFFDVNKEEERLFSEIGDKAWPTTSLTVKPEGDTRQEVSGEFTNMPLGICEGKTVVSQELNSAPSEEAQGGVPEHNNDPGQDTNTTQWFLEIRDSKEIQTIQFPEEVEIKEPEILQSSSTEADYSLAKENMEEEQKVTDGNKNSFDLVVEDPPGILCLTDPGSPQEREMPLVESEIQELLVDSMRTGIEHSEKEFEMHIGSTRYTEKTTKELQDGTEELLAEFETNEEICDKEVNAAGDDHETTEAAAAQEVAGFTDETLKFLEAEVQKMKSIFVDSDAMNMETNSCGTSSLPEDFSEFGFWRQPVETEPKLFGDSIVEMQYAGINMEKAAYKDKEEAANDELQSENLREILNFGIAVELTKAKTLTAESEALVRRNQLSDEINNVMNEAECEDEGEISAGEVAEYLIESEEINTKETVIQNGGLQDVIDEETPELWIETALSDDTDGIKLQDRPEPQQQMDIKTESLNEEQEEISSVLTESEEQPVESNSGRSESTSNALMLKQSSEIPMTSTGTGSFQDVFDLLVDMSEPTDVSELSSQQPMEEEAAETEQSYQKEEESLTETGVTSSRTRPQELDVSQDERDETGLNTEADVGLTELLKIKERKATENIRNPQSQAQVASIFKVEETKVEDENPEITVCTSADEMEDTESGQSRSGTDASLDEDTESGSQDDNFNETGQLLKLSLMDKLEPGWSEDNVGSLPGLNQTEVEENEMTESEDEMEVLFHI